MRHEVSSNFKVKDKAWKIVREGVVKINKGVEQLTSAGKSAEALLIKEKGRKIVVTLLGLYKRKIR